MGGHHTFGWIVKIPRVPLNITQVGTRKIFHYSKYESPDTCIVMDFQNNLGREEEDSQTRDIRRRRNKGGKSVSEEILTSSLAWKDEGRNAFRFAILFHCNHTIKVMLILMLLVFSLGYCKRLTWTDTHTSLC